MRINQRLFLVITAVFALLIEAKFAESADPVEQNRTRIENLEQRLRQLEVGHGGTVATPVEPLIGSWGCSNGAQSSTLTFLAGGQVLFEEPTLRTIERATWMRSDSEKIIISGSIRYEIRFTSKEGFEYTELNTRSTGTCHKL